MCSRTHLPIKVGSAVTGSGIRVVVWEFLWSCEKLLPDSLLFHEFPGRPNWGRCRWLAAPQDQPNRSSTLCGSSAISSASFLDQRRGQNRPRWPSTCSTTDNATTDVKIHQIAKSSDNSLSTFYRVRSSMNNLLRSMSAHTIESSSTNWRLEMHILMSRDSWRVKHKERIDIETPSKLILLLWRSRFF